MSIGGTDETVVFYGDCLWKYTARLCLEMYLHLEYVEILFAICWKPLVYFPRLYFSRFFMKNICFSSEYMLLGNIFRIYKIVICNLLEIFGTFLCFFTFIFFQISMKYLWQHLTNL